jgi:hypothetical protein
MNRWITIHKQINIVWDHVWYGTVLPSSWKWESRKCTLVTRTRQKTQSDVMVLIHHYKRIWWAILINFHLSAANFQINLWVVVHISNWWNWLWIHEWKQTCLHEQGTTIAWLTWGMAGGFETESLPVRNEGIQNVWPCVYVLNTAAVEKTVEADLAGLLTQIFWSDERWTVLM